MTGLCTPVPSLVVQDNVGQPNMLRRDVQGFHSAKFFGIPGQFVVHPLLTNYTLILSNETIAEKLLTLSGSHLFHPHVGRHDLSPQILKQEIIAR